MLLVAHLPSNSTKILAPIVQAVAVLVVNLRQARAEVFVHVDVRTINLEARPALRNPLGGGDRGGVPLAYKRGPTAP